MKPCLRPFWRYYGGKWRNAPHYPAPRHDVIVEPFAGAAGYALRHYQRRVILVDANPIIAGIWRYLIAVSPDEIRRLPDIPESGRVADMIAPQEARWLAGFWLHEAATHPGRKASSWAKREGGGPEWGGWGERSRERIASQVEAIRHWQVIEGDYTAAPDIEATWFVDPPYDGVAGHKYPSQPSSFDDLGTWCQARRGQVIVCEQDGADWLPFRALGSFRSASGPRRPKRSPEVVWTNDDPAQVSMFGALR